MKQLTKIYLLVSILLSGIMFSCDKINSEDDENGSSGNNNLKTGQIEIKAKNRIGFDITAKKVTIDWGDGSFDELPPNLVGKEFYHEYSKQNLQTIKVNTEGMTFFESFDESTYHELRFGNCPELKGIMCSGEELTSLDVSKCTALYSLDCCWTQLTSLDVSKCTALTSLACSWNQLTSLDVSKCKYLTWLDCSNNKLSASALNSLFNSLPTRESNDYARIYCGDNLGNGSCDKTIAEKKGWYVSYYSWK